MVIGIVSAFAIDAFDPLLLGREPIPMRVDTTSTANEKRFENKQKFMDRDKQPRN